MDDFEDFNDFELGGNPAPKVDESEARAKIIASFTDAPGATFTLTDYNDARRDKYGQDREWGRELLDELEEAGLIVRTNDVKEDGDEYGTPAYEVTDSTYILDQFRD